MPTERGTLEEVFGIERELAVQLDAVRQQAEEWLERTRREIEEGRRADIETVKAGIPRDERALEDAARARATSIVAGASATVERVQRLTDAELVALVRRHLAAIVPKGTA